MTALKNFNEHIGAGRFGEALALAETRHRELPLDPDWLSAIAVALHASGKAGDALGFMGRALALAPERGDLQNNFGVMLRAAGHIDEALAAYRRALALKPEDIDAHRNLVRALSAHQKLTDTIAACESFCASNPEQPEAWMLLGHSRMAMRDHAGAAKSFRRATELGPDESDHWRHYGLALAATDTLNEAEASLRAALALKPESALLWNDLGACIAGTCRPTEALAAYDKALALDPNDAKARYNRGTVLLRLGDFENGWRDYDARLEFPESRRTDLAQPLWDGRALKGRLLVHAEQGLGDTLQFSRFLKRLRPRCGEIVLEVQSPLLPLFAHWPHADQVIGRGSPIPECDFRIPLLSLPQRLGVTLEDIPPVIPFTIAAHPNSGELSSAKGPESGLRVGLVWYGNPKHSDDRHRSMPPEAFQPLLNIADVEFCSLQHGLAEVPWPKVINLAPRLTDWKATAEALLEIDLLISVDTSVAHLAGILGKPVWLLIAARSDWRWLVGRSDSPWYPGMRLFRQGTSGSWTEPIAEVRRQLVELVLLSQNQTTAG